MVSRFVGCNYNDNFWQTRICLFPLNPYLHTNMKLMYMAKGTNTDSHGMTEIQGFSFPSIQQWDLR